jgi:murein DD-endopeptidase MepM/ murein hydrolase activator NlpD
MLRPITLLFLLCILFGFEAKAQRALDTIETELGKVVLYSNKTWSFLQVSTFDGIMNPRIHQQMLAQDPSFRHPWSNDICFTSRNDMAKLKDTLWLCVNDEYDQHFHMPAPGIVTSRYGPRNGRNHNGIDIDLETGDTVYATWSGKVRYAKYNDGGYGNLVIIRHPNGLETLYAHLSKFLVYPDQDIVAGEPIGLGGNTGHSFGSHLHFEIRFYDAPMSTTKIILQRLYKRLLWCAHLKSVTTKYDQATPSPKLPHATAQPLRIYANSTALNRLLFSKWGAA